MKVSQPGVPDLENLCDTVMHIVTSGLCSVQCSQPSVTVLPTTQNPGNLLL